MMERFILHSPSVASPIDSSPRNLRLDYLYHAASLASDGDGYSYELTARQAVEAGQKIIYVNEMTADLEPTELEITCGHTFFGSPDDQPRQAIEFARKDGEPLFVRAVIGDDSGEIIEMLSPAHAIGSLVMARVNEDSKYPWVPFGSRINMSRLGAEPMRADPRALRQFLRVITKHTFDGGHLLQPDNIPASGLTLIGAEIPPFAYRLPE